MLAGKKPPSSTGPFPRGKRAAGLARTATRRQRACTRSPIARVIGHGLAAYGAALRVYITSYAKSRGLPALAFARPARWPKFPPPVFVSPSRGAVALSGARGRANAPVRWPPLPPSRSLARSPRPAGASATPHPRRRAALPPEHESEEHGAIVASISASRSLHSTARHAGNARAATLPRITTRETKGMISTLLT